MSDLWLVLQRVELLPGQEDLPEWVPVVLLTEEPTASHFDERGGDYVIYKAHGRREVDGLPPRFELEPGGRKRIVPPDRPPAPAFEPVDSFEPST